MNNKTKEIFTQIYDDNVGKIYRFIFLRVNSQEVAQDLTSEAFMKGWQAFKKASNPHPESLIENPRAFLYQIARNLVVDYYRAQSRTKIVLTQEPDIVDPRPNFEEKIMADSNIEQIKTELSHLSPEYQEVIIWHYVDDLSIREISGIVNKSEGAIRVMLHRALNSLKNKIEQV